MKYVILSFAVMAVIAPRFGEAISAHQLLCTASTIQTSQCGVIQNAALPASICETVDGDVCIPSQTFTCPSGEASFLKSSLDSLYQCGFNPQAGPSCPANCSEPYLQYYIQTARLSGIPAEQIELALTGAAGANNFPRSADALACLSDALGDAPNEYSSLATFTRWPQLSRLLNDDYSDLNCQFTAEEVKAAYTQQMGNGLGNGTATAKAAGKAKAKDNSADRTGVTLLFISFIAAAFALQL